MDALTQLLERLNSAQPPIFLVRWFKPWFIVQFEELLRRIESKETIALNAREKERDTFLTELNNTLHSTQSQSNTVLIFQGFESCAAEVAHSLNGYRELLFAFRAVYIFLRNDLFSQFARDAPDLLAVMRGNILRAEDYAPPITEEEIRQILDRYERKYKQTSSDFYKQFQKDLNANELDYHRWAAACDIAEWMGMIL